MSLAWIGLVGGYRLDEGERLMTPGKLAEGLAVGLAIHGPSTPSIWRWRTLAR